MLQIAQILNTIIFLTLSGLHYYWAWNSTLGKKPFSPSSAIPEINGKPAFVPSTFSTLVVATGLLLMAKISGYNLVPMISIQQFGSIIPYGNLTIAIIFFLRAIGDFRIVGFFKKIKGTKFAKNDTKYYSPLCIVISVCAFVIFYLLKV